MIDERFSPACLAELLDGGQAFRWNQQADGSWLGQWADCVCRIVRGEDGRIRWSVPAGSKKAVAKKFEKYFGLDQNWADLRDQLPWRSDAHLARCLEQFPGLRILRQPFGETLLCFLCSATKQIVQIKQMCENLARAFGHEVAPGFRALPDWERLALAPEADLRACGLGFRARYIRATAMILAENPGRLAEIEAMPYPDARDALMRLPGVGEKVADCVLLFSAGKLEAFPVDVWILRAMENRYGLRGWTSSQIAHFGRIHFGPLAGLAQQYLFAFERRRNTFKNGNNKI